MSRLAGTADATERVMQAQAIVTCVAALTDLAEGPDHMTIQSALYAAMDLLDAAVVELLKPKEAS